jgi:hypothetical protein
MSCAVSILDLEVAGQPQPILALAWISGMKPQPCIIMNYNRDAACLYSPVDLPDCFILRTIEGDAERLCQVLWRIDEGVGVRFVNARTMKVRPPLDALASNIIVLFPQ